MCDELVGLSPVANGDVIKAHTLPSTKSGTLTTTPDQEQTNNIDDYLIVYI